MSDVLCRTPQSTPRWIAGVLVPIECFDIRLTVHTAPGVDVFTIGIEVADPHTKELLAAWVNPTERYHAGVTLASQVSMELRTIVLALTDPDPF